MMNEKIKVLTVRFKNPLKSYEVEYFRGAVVSAIPNATTLFHNHIGDEQYRYSYPLVQYKRINGKAAILCIGDGVDSIGEFFAANDFEFKIGNREPERFEIETINANQLLVQAWNDSFRYTVRKWLPFNSENYREYGQLEGLAERVSFLQRILVGNILSMCKGLGIRLEREVVCEIFQIEDSRIITYKGVKMMSFDVEFKTNVSLPDFCGIGKGASLGMGMVKMMKEKSHPVKKLFLLGGHDLEMLTIRDLLEKREDCLVLDKELSWSDAYLSAYQEELEEYAGMQIYGVELQEDIDVPADYFRIDHHNDFAALPSAIEQVAACLKISLNRRQQLIAANDKGYIPAMKALFATEEEIAEIRRADRMAQGVTEKDEELATISIARNLEKCGGLLVVKSLTSKFSPICDELYPYTSLLVYTDREWIFYGEGKEKLVDLLSDEVAKKKVFFGGGANGYVGAVKDAYSVEEIDEFINYVKQDYK